MPYKKKQATPKSRKEKELLKYDSYCPICDTWFIADSTGMWKQKYCKECGGELVLPSICVVCGSILPAPSKFCSGCGFIAIS